MKKRRHPASGKATNMAVTAAFLQQRYERSAKLGFQKQRWIEFCERLIADGFSLTLYEARRTASKYITVTKGGRSFKVRFSNHKPIKGRELAGDCDFFVGMTHTGTRTTHDALAAVAQHFAQEMAG